MRKFKLFFYPIYIIITLVVLYFSVDIMVNIEEYKADITFSDLKKAPVYLLSLFIFLCLFMLTELVVENTHIISLKNKVKQAEQEVLSLKARLYDKSQTVEPEAKPTEEGEDSFEDEDED
ncbi:MAG: hypothetical protein ABJH57_02670, partial [Cyclobacteriaceae bacterium]